MIIPLKEHYLVKVFKHEGKVGNIWMPAWRLGSEFEAQKYFRYQTCEILDNSKVSNPELNVGDRVLIRRWGARHIQGEYWSLKADNRILAKCEE